MTSQSADFISKKQYRITKNTISQSVFCAQVTSSAKVYETISGIEHVNAQELKFKKTFDLTKQNEELIEPYRVKKYEISDIEILKKVRHGYHAANFSCANLNISLKTMQPSSNELESAVTLLKQVFTIYLPSKGPH